MKISPCKSQAELRCLYFENLTAGLGCRVSSGGLFLLFLCESVNQGTLAVV
jgi:hypothetical protein